MKEALRTKRQPPRPKSAKFRVRSFAELMAEKRRETSGSACTDLESGVQKEKSISCDKSANTERLPKSRRIESSSDRFVER